MNLLLNDFLHKHDYIYTFFVLKNKSWIGEYWKLKNFKNETFYKLYESYLLQHYFSITKENKLELLKINDYKMKVIVYKDYSDLIKKPHNILFLEENVNKLITSENIKYIYNKKMNKDHFYFIICLYCIISIIYILL